ncbi:MAG: hypothetical protein ACI8WY_003135, partial [Planctomycetota bacterium]
MSAPSPLLDANTLDLGGTTMALISPETSSFWLQGDGPATPGGPVTRQVIGPVTPGAAGSDGGTTGAAAPTAGNPLQSIMMFALIGAVIWFLIFAPERKNRKKREVMLGGVKKGDKVV